MKTTNECVEKNATYNEKCIISKPVSAPIVVKPGTVDESIIADYLKEGFGCLFTT